jgi:SAM-dependent methyltransferase
MVHLRADNIDAMANTDMAEYWNTRGGHVWVNEQDRFDTMLEPCGRRVLDKVGLVEGERVLDVGCGNGVTTLEAALRVGASGSAVGIDLSGPMLDAARARASALGRNVTFIQGDAQIASFEAPFDVVISRFGVMFFEHPVAAFANLAGALRPGGRICFVCWREMFANEWISVPAMAIVAHVGIPDPGPADAPGPFAFAEPARVRRILEEAGLSDVEIDEASDPLRMGSDPEDVVAFMATDEMGRRVLEGKDPDKVADALEAAREALRPYATPEGVSLRSAYWVVTARKP